MRRIAWVGVLLLLMAAGCGIDRNDSLLADAEACMEIRADSARWLLEQMDSVLTEDQSAHYALLWTQAAHKCHIPQKDDSLINVAVEYYGGTNDRHRLAKALLYKGLVHKQCGDVERAVEAFVASEQVFEEVEDDQYKALLYNHYASLLAKQGLLEKALVHYKKSYQYKLRGDSLHYVVSACNNIATIYELLGQMDSAQNYYEKGMSYAGVDNRKLLHNYANHLMKRGLYNEAERMLKNNEALADSAYIYNLYSALATLYYEMGKYEDAFPYGEKMLGSTDSMTQCVGYLHLYRIHRKVGNTEVAVYYHDLYRQYDSDITLRRKTAEVAAIPYQLANRKLQHENKVAYRWLCGWGIGLVVAVTAAIYIIRYIKREHGTQMAVMDGLLSENRQALCERECLLAEKQSLLEDIESKLYGLKIELGRMKGGMTKQSNALASMKNELAKDKNSHHESMKELLQEIKNVKEKQKMERRERQEETRSLNRQLKLSQGEQKRWMEEVSQLSERVEQYELLQRFLLDGGNVKSVLLVWELRSGMSNRRFPIRHDEYAGLLKQLAEYARSGICQLMENDPVMQDKQVLVCLVSLGYHHDMEMLCRATNLKVNSVRAYSSQVKVALAKYGIKFD